jgi:hypothetical protein
MIITLRQLAHTGTILSPIEECGRLQPIQFVMCIVTQRGLLVPLDLEDNSRRAVRKWLFRIANPFRTLP